MSTQKTIAELEAELLAIKAAAAGIRRLLDSALSNASGNPEHESVKRRVEALKAAVGGLPAQANDDSELLDGLEELVFASDVDFTERNGRYSIFTTENVTQPKECQGPDLRQAIRNAIKR